MKILLLLFTFSIAFASSIDRLAYQGRLLQANGAPITGPVELVFKLYKNADPTIQCSQTISNIPLFQGIFNVELTFPALCTGAITFHQLLLNSANSGDTLYIEITDTTNTTTYDKQNITAKSFAMVASHLIGSLDATQISPSNIDNSEHEALNNLTGAIQTQIDSKLDNSVTGSCSNAGEHVKNLSLSGGNLQMDCVTHQNLW